MKVAPTEDRGARNMMHEILEELRQKAKDCTKNYKCLSCKPSELCQIKSHSTDGGTCLIECATDEECAFLEAYEESKITICNCPVRQELQRQYAV